MDFAPCKPVNCPTPGDRALGRSLGPTAWAANMFRNDGPFNNGYLAPTLPPVAPFS